MKLNRRKFVKAAAGIVGVAGLASMAGAGAPEESAATNGLKKPYTPGKASVSFGGGPGSAGNGGNASANGGSPAKPVADQKQTQTEPSKRGIRKAIMYATVPGNLSVMDKFKMLRDTGFEGVEPMSGMDRNKVMRARDAAGLQIPSVCVSTHWMEPLSDPNPAVRERGVEGLKTALQDCKTYGGTSVLLVPAIVNKQVSYADAYTRSQEEIRKVIPFAEELGVKMAIENVWNYFLMSPLEAARYVDEFKSGAVGWHFDVGNIIAWGWPEQWISVLGSRIQKLHIKEYSRKKRDDEGLWKGFQVDYLEGDNNWPVVMKALDDIGYNGWAIGEPAYHPPGLDDFGFLKNVSEKMSKILNL